MLSRAISFRFSVSVLSAIGAVGSCLRSFSSTCLFVIKGSSCGKLRCVLFCRGCGERETTISRGVRAPVLMFGCYRCLHVQRLYSPPSGCRLMFKGEWVYWPSLRSSWCCLSGLEHPSGSHGNFVLYAKKDWWLDFGGLSAWNLKTKVWVIGGCVFQALLWLLWKERNAHSF